jgi:hypothetical protein
MKPYVISVHPIIVQLYIQLHSYERVEMMMLVLLDDIEHPFYYGSPYAC